MFGMKKDPCNCIEVSDIRQKLIKERKWKKELNKKRYFYYDETENFGKLRIDNNKISGFNCNLTTTFVLGGIVCKNEISDETLKELMLQIKVKNKPREIKSKNIYGSGDDYSKQINNKNLYEILTWLDRNKIHIHYTSYCAGYSVCNEIINTINRSESEGEKLLLVKILFELIIKDEKSLANILEKFNYPTIDSDKYHEFWNEIIDWINFDQYLYKISFSEYNIKSLSRLIIHKNMETLRDNLVYAKENNIAIQETLEVVDKGVIINDLAVYYQLPTALFLKSQHIFDNEKIIQKIMNENPICIKRKRIDNYKFVDSKENMAICVSDWIVGILGRTFNFLRRTNETEMKRFIKSINDLQRKNLIMLGKVISNSYEENPCYIRSYDEFGQIGRLEWITEFRVFEIKAHLDS